MANKRKFSDLDQTDDEPIETQAKLYTELPEDLKTFLVNFSRGAGAGKKPMVFLNPPGKRGPPRYQLCKEDNPLTLPFGISKRFESEDSSAPAQSDTRRTIQIEITNHPELIEAFMALDEYITEIGVKNMGRWFQNPKDKDKPPRQFTREEIIQKRAAEEVRSQPRYLVVDRRAEGYGVYLQLKINTPLHNRPPVIERLSRDPKDPKTLLFTEMSWDDMFDAEDVPKKGLRVVPIVEISSLNFNGGYGATVIVTNLYVLKDVHRPTRDYVCAPDVKLVKLEKPLDDDENYDHPDAQALSSSNHSAFPGEN